MMRTDVHRRCTQCYTVNRNPVPVLDAVHELTWCAASCTQLKLAAAVCRSIKSSKGNVLSIKTLLVAAASIRA
jgi:hypothetical protein